MNNDPLSQNPSPEPVAEPSETTGEVAPPVKATPSEPASTESITTVKQPKAAKPRTSRKKVTIVIAVAIALLVAAAIGYWYFVARKSSTPAPVTNQSTATVPDTKPFTPAKIMYNQRSGTSSVLASVPFQGGTPSTIPSVQNPLGMSIHDNMVATSTSETSNGQATITLQLSTDSGQTFNAIYKQTMPQPTTSPGSFITSQVIATDGSQVLFALYGENGINTIKAYDISKKTTTDLFTVPNLAVDLKGYNPTSQKVYYFTSCAMCDGKTDSVLYQYDITAKSQSEVYSDDSKFGITLQFNQDLTKAVVARGVQSNMWYTTPYTVQELTVATKSLRDIATVTTGLTSQAGYTSDYKSIYYSEGNNIYSVGANGNKVLAFQAEQPIYQVHYVGTDFVITSVSTVPSGGSSTPPKVATITFDVATNKATSVLNTTSDQYVYGVSLSNQ